jgi:hypothetical protein
MEKKLKPITKENNGPSGHKIPDFFKQIAGNLPNDDDYHKVGLPETLTSEESGEIINTLDIDEGEFSKIQYNVPEKPFVKAKSLNVDKYYIGEKFWLND